MCLLSWAESKIHALRWYDVSLIKLASAAFALMVAKLWPPLLSLDWQGYLAIMLIAAAPVCVKMLRKAQ